MEPVLLVTIVVACVTGGGWAASRILDRYNERLRALHEMVEVEKQREVLRKNNAPLIHLTRTRRYFKALQAHYQRDETLAKSDNDIATQCAILLDIEQHANEVLQDAFQHDYNLQHGYEVAGVSIATIASEVGFTKQGLLHYFDSKEKLYGAILQRISDDFQEQQTEAEQASGVPIERLRKFYAALAEPTETNTRRTRLLMRELLDNNARATKAENWYLREFLERLIGMVKAIESLQTVSDEEALTFAYQLLGAVNYFLISPATLSGIFGKDVMQRISANFSAELDLLIAAKIQAASR